MRSSSFMRMMFPALFALLLPALAYPQTLRPSRGENDRDLSRPQTVREDVARTRFNRPEYVASVPINRTDAFIAALQEVGARQITLRELAALDRSVVVFDLGPGRSLEDARRRLDQVGLSQNADFNTLYEYAQSQPRLYAAAMVGDPVTDRCSVPRTQRIGLIDGPVNAGHVALQDAAIIAETALDDTGRPLNSGHGTAVASLIVGNDPEGVLTGFAPGAQLFAADAFAQEHSGVAADVDRIGASLSWLLANDVRLINMSFTGPPNTVLEDLLEQAERAGAILIAAAGNDGRNVESYPAAAPSVIAVTAVDANMRRYRRANWGPHIEFAAPGVDLYVAQSDGGAYVTGTSYAAPIITALAARSGATSVGQLRGLLQRQAFDLGDPGRDVEFGWGLVRNIGC